MAKKRKGEAHVRLYRHELECEAYRSLSTDARALLVEFRALYGGKENRVYMSRSEIMRRLSIGRWRAEKARDELLDRGFLRLLEPASFNRKVRHAPVYALTNEPLDPGRDGAVAPKDFMKWKKSTGLVTSPDGVSHQPRGRSSDPPKGPNGVSHQPRKGQSGPTHGASHQPPDRLPGSTDVPGGPEGLLSSALAVDGESQFKLCLGALLASATRMGAAA